MAVVVVVVVVVIVIVIGRARRRRRRRMSPGDGDNGSTPLVGFHGFAHGRHAGVVPLVYRELTTMVLPLKRYPIAQRWEKDRRPIRRTVTFKNCFSFVFK